MINKKFENLYGMVGEESVLSSNLRKSRVDISKKSMSGLRKSVTSKFFLRADSESIYSSKTPDMIKRPTFNEEYKPKIFPQSQEQQKNN